MTSQLARIVSNSDRVQYILFFWCAVEHFWLHVEHGIRHGATRILRGGSTGAPELGLMRASNSFKAMGAWAELYLDAGSLTTLD